MLILTFCASWAAAAAAAQHWTISHLLRFRFACLLPLFIIFINCFVGLGGGASPHFHLSITTPQPPPQISGLSNIQNWHASASYSSSHPHPHPNPSSLNRPFTELYRDQLSNLTQAQITQENIAQELTNDLETWKAPYVIRKNFPYYLAGYDDEDRPIWVAEFGKYNIRKVVEEGEEMMRLLDKYTNQAFYRIIKSIEERNREGNEVKEAMFLVDFDGLSLYQVSHLPTAVYAIKLARRYSYLLNNFMGGAIIVNANYLAVRLLNFLRPLQGRAFERIDIYGTNRAAWIPRIRRMFPPESLPIWYGGIKNFSPLRLYG